MTKFISWNVNGLRACITKGFLDYFSEVDADVFCLQEIKLSPDQLELTLDGYQQYYNFAEKKRLLWNCCVYENTSPKLYL